jgi:hypothetical protein
MLQYCVWYLIVQNVELFSFMMDKAVCGTVERVKHCIGKLFRHAYRGVSTVYFTSLHRPRLSWDHIFISHVKMLFTCTMFQFHIRNNNFTCEIYFHMWKNMWNSNKVTHNYLLHVVCLLKKEHLSLRFHTAIWDKKVN